MLKLALAAVALVTTVAIAACAGTQTQEPSPFSAALAFDYPPLGPGYQWTRNGQTVSTEELGASAGSDHCGWGSATILAMGWPMGTFGYFGHWRFYIRDPKRVMPYTQALIKGAQLPASAQPTGYRLGSIELYLSAVDHDQAVYLVSPSGIERWPRADPFVGCK
jgi:hypothetical protein